MRIGDWSSDVCSSDLLALAAFVAAALVVPGVFDRGGVGFDGLFIADSFAAFAKILVYIAAAVSLIAAAGWFRRDGVYRAEYPVLILLSAVGMGMMVSAGDLLTLYVGLELLSLASYVLAAFQRKDTRSAEAGLKYFVLGALQRHPPLRHLLALRLHRVDPVPRGLAGGRPRRPLDRGAVWYRLRPCRHRLQGQRRALPHVDSGRLRRRADARRRLFRQRPQGRRRRPARPRRYRGDGPGDQIGRAHV